MDEKTRENLEKMGIVYVPPKEGDYELIAQFNPVQKRSAYHNQSYQENIERMAKILNRNKTFRETSISKNITGPHGEVIQRMLNTPFNREGQLQIEKFRQLTKANEIFTFDIETIGDALNKGNFSVTEVAIQGFKRQGHSLVPSNKSLTQVIAPSQEVQNEMIDVINKLKMDPYQFNLLPDHQKRAIVDLTRYSDLTEGDVSPVNFIKRKGKLVDIQHNTFAQRLISSEELIPSRVIDNMPTVLQHAEAGLKRLSSIELTPNQAINQINTFLKEHQHAMFVSYNGDHFDIPALLAWSKGEINKPINHVDYYRVIQTVYPNPLDLHREFNPDLSTNMLQIGATRLQSLRQTLGFDTTQAHSATHDIGMEGLAGVVDRTLIPIEKRIEQGERDVPRTFQFSEPGFTWSNEPLQKGQKLFAVSGVRARQDGELSFQAKFDPEKGVFNPINTSFNTTVINAKTLYEVQDLLDLSDESTKRFGLQLYNPENDTYAFIIREGDNAVHQIADFVQSRFYNYDNMPSSLLREIEESKLTDRARRRYERLFSLEKGGTGQTGGFEAARRLYSNAAIFEQRIMGKDKFIRGENYAELVKNRITHEELMNQMRGRFDSLWDPEMKRWIHNPQEQEEFFRMGMRLISERPIFQPALEYIAENLEDPKERDLAWRLYTDKVFAHFPARKEEVELQDFESRRVSFVDYTTNREHTLNMTSQATTLQSIERYVYDIKNREDLAPDVRQDRYRERLNLYIKNLRANDVINDKLANNLIELNTNSASVHNAMMEISAILQNSDINFNSRIKQTSLGFNEAIQSLDQDTNRLMFEEAVRKVRELQQTEFHPNQAPGSRVTFSSSVEKALSRLDQPHLSRLTPNNRIALERVIGSIMDDERFKHYHVAVSLDEITANARISIYRPEHSSSIVEHLAKGLDHPNVLNINMPLINEYGIHTIGNRRINARTIADYVDGRIVYKSTAEAIADAYVDNISRIMAPMFDGDVELANKRARQTLNESVQVLSGIQRNLTFSDTYDANFNYNQSDFFKQSQVEIERAYIKDLFTRGDLTRDDFYTQAFIDGRLRSDVSLEDLKPKKAYEILLNLGDWLRENDLNLYAATVKGDHVSLARLSTLDIRDYIPYGHYTFMGRDNTIQFMNTHILSPEVVRNLQEATRDTNAYLNFNELVTTEAQREWMNLWRQQAGGSQPGVNVKVAYMNDQELMDRLRALRDTAEGRKILLREGIINEDGSWNHTNIPSVYENQGIIASDIHNQMRMTEQKILTQSENFELFRDIEHGTTVQPGQVLGFEYIEGYKKPIRYQGKEPGKVILQNGRLAVAWEEQAFKYMLEGEKVTDLAYSRELIQALTGDDSVSVIMNANMLKHRDFSMFLSGKAKILAEHIQDLYEDFVQKSNMSHPNDAASRKALERTEAEERLNRAIRMAGKVNLEWDEATQTFIQRGNRPIPQNRFDRIFRALGIDDKTPLGYESAILEMRVSKVSNYSSMTDETGRKVLSVDYDKDGNLVRRYYLDDHGSPVRGGVTWGHREMGVLRDLGLHETYQQVYYEMMHQAQERGRLQETRNMIAALTGAVDPDSELVRTAGALRVEDFRTLPELDPDLNTYRQTIFDQDHVRRLLGEKVSPHGYWLELPDVIDPHGNRRTVTVNMYGEGKDRVQVDRIFIPFTNLDETQGKVFLRELQRKIGDIYRKADEVVRSGSYQERSRALDKLQKAVDSYYEQLTYDITSSKGQTGERVLKASMPMSGSGLFKLLDPEISMDLDGEYTFISTEDAKKMGVYDTLRDIELRRAAGEAVEDLYVMNVRYPTFHSHAMQVARLRMSDDVRPGEFKTTSWISDLMEADSDGDYDNIVVMTDEKVQKEWRELYNRKQREAEAAYQAMIEKESRAGRKFTAEYILGDATKFEAFDPNTQDELVAKVGKRVVGQASNLNLFMRQVADEYLDHASSERRAIHDFGQEIEQRLISSKHGLTVEQGRAPAIELINAIRNSKWEEARALRARYFADDLTEEVMEEAIRGLQMIEGNLRQGLSSPTLRFGTSFGVPSDVGLKKVRDFIYGTAPLDERVTTNTTLSLLQQMMEIDAAKRYIDLEGNEYTQVDPYESIYTKPRLEDSGGIASKLGNIAEDITGVGYQEEGSKVKQFIETVSKNKTARWSAIGAGLALGALGAYNVFKYREPLEDPFEYGDDQYYNVNISEPYLDLGSNAFQESLNADIQIRATGGNFTEQELAYMVNEGIQGSGMNTGPSRVTINHIDNTQKLNRIWYRDKVQENI